MRNPILPFLLAASCIPLSLLGADDLPDLGYGIFVVDLARAPK